MAIVGSFQEDLDIYLADYKGRSGASKQSDKDLKKIGNKAKGITAIKNSGYDNDNKSEDYNYEEE